ncbi:MAG: hypothetical protein CMO81_05760 [Waddliaceae bacterium]|nr:hypothetical protein [Waddliaceae bacterium]
MRQKTGRGRTPRNYDGVDLTSHHLTEVLPLVLQGIARHHKDRPDVILAAWPEIIGSPLASMTQALSFVDGILTVRVKNSTLYSLLTQRDKPRILHRLRSKFPKVEIRNISFRMG